MKSFHKVSKKRKLKDQCSLSCLPIGQYYYMVSDAHNLLCNSCSLTGYYVL